MRTRTRLLWMTLSGAILLLDMPAVTLQAQRPAAPPKPDPTKIQYVANRVLVKPKRGQSPATLDSQHAAIRGRIAKRFERVGNLELVELPADVSVGSAIEYYKRGGAAEYAEPDYIVSIAQRGCPTDC